MSHRLFVRSGATVAAVAMAALAAGPAFAAAPVAQGTASAVTLNIASQDLGTGTYVAQNDGKTETTSGSNQPSLNAVANQTLLTAGTASQDAKTSVEKGVGKSAACASVAGSGSSLVSTGVGASCLKGGSALSLDAGHIDLSKVTVTQGLLLAGVGGSNGTQLLSSLGLGALQPVQDLLNTIGSGLTPATTTLDQVLQGVLGPLSNQVLAPLLNATGLSVGLDLGAVYASCQADPKVATGGGTVAKLGLRVGLPAQLGGPITIPVDLNTGENVPIVTDLDKVVTAITNALTGALTGLVTGNTYTSQLAPVISQVNGGLTALVKALNDNLLAVLSDQLKPLEDAVLKGVLNKVERRDGGRTIDVTALDLQVLPAAASVPGSAAFLGDNSSLVGLSAAHVVCGPNSTLTTTTTTTTDDNDTPTVDEGTPTEVKSGIGSLEDAPSALAMAGLVGLVLAGTGAGIAGFRRSLRP